MRDVYVQIADRLRSGRRFAVATLVAVRDALPAPIGTSLLVDDDGSFVGNIGAGCHEAEIVEAAREVVESCGSKTLDFTLDDELLSGSVCGASLRVFVWSPDATFLATADAIASGAEDVAFALASHAVAIAAKRRLIVVGATDLAAQMTELAHALDFVVTIVDPRPAFASVARHPHADRVIVAWPNDALPELLRTCAAVAIVSHDSKIDLPAIRAALASEVAYIGVLGSRRAQRARSGALDAEGYTEAQLARIHGPAGIDLGGTTSAQTATSILAEVLATLNARSGVPLRGFEGSIHRV
jgi:xanthine dehydrogenase accessory factor